MHPALGCVLRLQTQSRQHSDFPLYDSCFFSVGHEMENNNEQLEWGWALGSAGSVLRSDSEAGNHIQGVTAGCSTKGLHKEPDRK